MSSPSLPVASLPPTPRTPKILVRLVISLAIAAGFVWILHRGGVPVVPRAAAFAHVRWWVVPAYLVSLLVVHWFRAWRWDYLLRPVARVPTRTIIAIAWVGFAAIMLLPLRLGEVVRPALIRRNTKVSGAAAMGTVAAERVLDGLFVALLLVGTLHFVPRLPLEGVTFSGISVARIPTMGYLLAEVFGAALVTLGVFLVSRDFAEKATLKVLGAVSPKLAVRLSQIVGGLADGLRSLPDPRLMGPFLLQTALYWSFNALGMWMLGVGCGLPMTPGQGFAVMGVLAMGILLPAGPGLFGVFQLSVFLALRMFFPDETVRSAGEAYVFIMYVSQFCFNSAAGLIALRTEHLNPREAVSS